jgi:hypothetical protein
MRAGEIARGARTAAQLRPGQMGQRVRLRAQRMAMDHRVPLVRRWLLAGPDPASAAGWPTAFIPLDTAVWRDWTGGAALLAGELNLLGVTRTVAPAGESGVADWTAADWTMAGVPLLWRFHLYYWDWAWGLAASAAGEPRAPRYGSPGPRPSIRGAGRSGTRTRRPCAPGRCAGFTRPW